MPQNYLNKQNSKNKESASGLMPPPLDPMAALILSRKYLGTSFSPRVAQASRDSDLRALHLNAQVTPSPRLDQSRNAGMYDPEKVGSLEWLMRGLDQRYAGNSEYQRKRPDIRQQVNNAVEQTKRFARVHPDNTLGPVTRKDAIDIAYSALQSGNPNYKGRVGRNGRNVPLLRFMLETFRKLQTRMISVNCGSGIDGKTKTAYQANAHLCLKGHFH